MNIMLKQIVEALEERKGADITVLHVEAETTLAEYFVLCTATSTTQVGALAENVEFKLKTENNITVHHVEGKKASGWILLDYGSVLINVFLDETRNFYDMEKLWQNAKQIDISSL